MARAPKVDSLARDIDVMINETLSPEAQARAFADWAREQKVEMERTNRSALGKETRIDTIVNGVRGAPEASVTVPGTIVYEADVGLSIVAEALDMVRQHAPVKSGRFRNTILIYADGHEVPSVEAAEGAAEVAITSGVPYARKLEGQGATAENPKKWMSSQALDGIFQAVSLLLKARYSRVASIKFSFVSVSGSSGMLEDWASATSFTRKRFDGGGERKTRARNEWLRRQPAVVIRFR